MAWLGLVSATPWWGNDGSANAPVIAAGAQHPTWLNDENFRPPWKVAGIDYAVAIPDASFPLKVPGVNSLPSGATFNGTDLVTLSQNGVVLDGWNFVDICLNVANFSATVQNCSFSYTKAIARAAPIYTIGGTFIFKNNIVDGTNIEWASWAGCLLYCVATAVDIEYTYNWFKNAPNDFLNFGGGPIIVRYNVLENSAIGPTIGLKDSDFFQWTAGTPSPTIEFNTLLQNQGANGAGGNWSQGIYLANQVFVNSVIRFNTMRTSPGASPTGSGVQMHFWWGGATTGSSNNLVQYNYADLTNTFGWAINENNSTSLNNTNMVTGADLG